MWANIQLWVRLTPKIRLPLVKGGNTLRDTAEIFMFLSIISMCFQGNFITVIE